MEHNKIVKKIWFLDLCHPEYGDYNVIYGENIGYKKFKDWATMFEFICDNSMLVDILIFEGANFEKAMIERVLNAVKYGKIPNRNLVCSNTRVALFNEQNDRYKRKPRQPYISW